MKKLNFNRYHKDKKQITYGYHNVANDFELHNRVKNSIVVLTILRLLFGVF